MTTVGGQCVVPCRLRSQRKSEKIWGVGEPWTLLPTLLSPSCITLGMSRMSSELEFSDLQDGGPTAVGDSG